MRDIYLANLQQEDRRYGDKKKEKKEPHKKQKNQPNFAKFSTKDLMEEDWEFIKNDSTHYK